MQYDLVIPLGPQHYNLFKKNIKRIASRVNANRVIVITNSLLINQIKKKYPKYIFIDEDAVIESLNLKAIREYLLQRIEKRERAGWYFQQFLKMGYAFQSQNPYYLVWDSDTLPHKKLTFFSENKILFSYSGEYHIPYFETMERLIGLSKTFAKSFIVEHMMFDSKIMIELINQIQNKNTNQPWFFNILDAIDDKFLNYSGFSEFETYGTYMFQNYKDCYKPRYLWHNRMDSNKLSFIFYKKRVAETFDTSSFENWIEVTLKMHLLNCKITKENKKNFKEIEWKSSKLLKKL